MYVGASGMVTGLGLGGGAGDGLTGSVASIIQLLAGRVVAFLSNFETWVHAVKIRLSV